MSCDPEQKRRPRERVSLKGLFDRDAFAIRYIDEVFLSFMAKIVFYLHGLSTVCMVAFMRHQPSAKVDDVIFYRWFAWNENWNLNEKTLDVLQWKNEEMRMGFLSREFASSREWTLAGEFLKCLSARLADKPVEQLSEIELTPADDQGDVPKMMKYEESFWVLEEPKKCLYFWDTVKPASSEWCVYRPIMIRNRLAGVITLDGTGAVPSSKKSGDRNAWERIKSALQMLEKTVQSFYFGYYSQLDDLPAVGPEFGPDDYTWDMEGLVYSPTFLNELSSIILDKDPGQRPEFLPSVDVADGYVVAYFDGNGIKQLNDSLGHSVGTEVIRAIGRWLNDAFYLEVCASEENKPWCWVTRVGSDEFVVIIAFPSGTPEGDKSRWKDSLASLVHSHICGDRNLIEDLDQRLNRLGSILLPPDKRGMRIPLKGLVGIAGGWCEHSPGRKYSQIWPMAETAMYTAKSFMKDTPMKGRSGASCLDIRVVETFKKGIRGSFPEGLAMPL